MKVRPILLLLLLAGSILLVGWLYHAVTRPAMKAQTNDHRALLTELDSCCRAKHSHAVQYAHYAQRAEEEQAMQAATLFRALALSARVQEQQTAEVIRKLGGGYRPPRRILLFRNTTEGNLAASLARHRRRNDSLEHLRIRRQMQQGHRMAARVLIWSAATARREAHLLAAHLAAPQQATNYLICPHCGNLYRAEATDPYCPHCLTDSHRFIRVSRNGGGGDAVQ